MFRKLPNTKPSKLPRGLIATPSSIKYFPPKKSSITSTQSPQKHTNKNKQTIDSRTNKDQIQDIVNQRIERLVQQLYPKLDQADKDRSKQKRNPWDGDQVFDSYTSQRKLENKMSMNAAQRQLDQRLKNKLVQKSKKSSGQMIRSYKQEYQEIKRQQRLRVSTENNSYYQPPEVSPEGVYFYQHLKYRPALLKYTIQRIKQKQQQRGLHHNPDMLSMPILSILNKRKKKQLQNQQKIDLKQQFQIQHYKKQISNINNISNRLKRIYSKQNELKINDHQIQQIQNSRIIKHQHVLLEEIDDVGRVSKKNKDKLVFKFNQILSQYGKSSSRRKIILDRMDQREEDSSRVVKASRARKRNQFNYSSQPSSKNHQTL